MPDRYAVIGNPIAQSQSPVIHGLFARAHGQDMAYERLLAPLDGFEATVRDFIARGGRGLNVTAPFKLQALALATHPLPRAAQAGATNALRFVDGRIEAENFDGLGLVADLLHNQRATLAGARVLLLGAGGAARGALPPLLAQAPAALVVANRHAKRAVALAQTFGAHGPVTGCGLQDLGGERFDLVLNATSASLTGDLPAVPATVFGPDALAYELAYGKGLTPFLRLAANAGVRHLADGVGMLVEQAAEAFFWWRGVRPGTAEAIRQLTVPLR